METHKKLLDEGMEHDLWILGEGPDRAELEQCIPASDDVEKSIDGAELTASVQNGNVYGCQFHPEKSGNTGLRILKSFAEGELKA